MQGLHALDMMLRSWKSLMSFFPLRLQVAGLDNKSMYLQVQDKCDGRLMILNAKKRGSRTLNPCARPSPNGLADSD